MYLCVRWGKNCRFIDCALLSSIALSCLNISHVLSHNTVLCSLFVLKTLVQVPVCAFGKGAFNVIQINYSQLHATITLLQKPRLGVDTKLKIHKQQQKRNIWKSVEINKHSKGGRVTKGLKTKAPHFKKNEYVQLL